MVEAETLALAALGVGAYAYLSGGTAEKPRDKAIEIPTFPQIQVLRERVPEVVRVPETKIIEVPAMGGLRDGLRDRLENLDDRLENLDTTIDDPDVVVPPKPPEIPSERKARVEGVVPGAASWLFGPRAGREAEETAIGGVRGIQRFLGGAQERIESAAEGAAVAGLMGLATPIPGDAPIWAAGGGAAGLLGFDVSDATGGVVDRATGFFEGGKKKAPRRGRKTRRERQRKEREAPTRIRKRRKRKSRIRKRRKRKSRQRKDKDRGPSSVSVIRKRRERLGFRPKTTEWGAQFWA